MARVNPLDLQRPMGGGPLRPLVPAFAAGLSYRVGLAQLAAISAIAVILAVDTQAGNEGRIGIGFAIVVALAMLRTLHSTRPVSPSTVVLDAVGTAVVLAGTGSPASPLSFIALAGVWWAAHVHRPHTGLLYAATYIATYVLLVLPQAISNRMLLLALEDIAIVGFVGLLSDSFVRIDRRALELSEALARAPAGVEELALRAGLTRALGVTDVPVEIVLSAARAGLTVVQAELLAYLSMGLTNQEIADATRVTEATVRYRLTRLYRQLGARGRKEAVARAWALGVTLHSLQN